MTTATRARAGAVAVERVDATAYAIPTPEPESDGTLTWAATDVVVVEVTAGGEIGVGYTYAPPAAAEVVATTMAQVVEGSDALATGACWDAMVRAVRNQGRPGIAGCALSAVDLALWDLKAKVHGVSVASLLGANRAEVPCYGSGGFTSQTTAQLGDQLGGWVEAGLGAVKMKVGRDPDADPDRVAAARRAIGPDAGLFVDANGAYTAKQALELADEFADHGVTWFEEPVSSDDLEGLRLVRERTPAAMDVAAGEYGYDLPSFERMLAAGAVDCLQADVTRCGGITAFVRVAALAQARCLEVSAHTAPQVSAHACCGVPNARHLEWFADHVRVEPLLFDGVLEPIEGCLRPDRDRPGLGIELRLADAARYRR